MGAWIEILKMLMMHYQMPVAPYMGAWIEISSVITSAIYPLLSLPIWGRGLKFAFEDLPPVPGGVAPYMGAWIEILKMLMMHYQMPVAPYMGAWIEMCQIVHHLIILLSLPIWGRGLKQIYIST